MERHFLSRVITPEAENFCGEGFKKGAHRGKIQKKILVAIDASEGAKRAIDYVGSMADISRWEVTLFHAIRDIDKNKLHQTEKIMASIFKDAADHLEKAGFNRDQIKKF